MEPVGRGSVLDRMPGLRVVTDFPKPGLRPVPANTCGEGGAGQDWRWVGKEEAPSFSLLALPPGLRPVLPCQPGKQVLEEVTTQDLGLSRVCAIVR